MDGLIADVSIPNGLFSDIDLFVYVRVHVDGSQANAEPELVIGSGGESVPLRDRSLLRLSVNSGRRVSIFTATRNGDKLCTWQPSVRIAKLGSFPSGARLRDIAEMMYRNVGDPILLTTGGETVRQDDSFTIDGASMAVLSFSRYFVVLQDPEPRLGMRTIRWRGYQATLRFIAVRLQLSRNRSKAKLIVTVSGLDNLTRDVGLALLNFDRGTFRLRCWDTTRDLAGLGTDRPDMRHRIISRRQVHGGNWQGACSVIGSTEIPGLPMVEARVLELPPRHPLVSPLPRW